MCIGCTSCIVKSFRSPRSFISRFQVTVRRHKFNKASLSVHVFGLDDAAVPGGRSSWSFSSLLLLSLELSDTQIYEP